MAGKFKLNTGGIATLVQVLAGVPSGNVYDHKVLASAGTVTLANENDMATVRKLELGGQKLLTET